MMLSLSACQSFHRNEAMKIKSRNYKKKLPNLELVYENEKEVKHWKPGELVVRENTPYATMFYREAENNLIEQDTNPIGYIKLRPIYHKTKNVSLLYALTPLLTLWTFNILGCPLEEFEAIAELEIEILNKEGKLVKKYNSEAKDTEYTAFWWGYNSFDAQDSSLYNSYKKALFDITEQIQNDMDYLNKKLKY